jgi:hypothetical protein
MKIADAIKLLCVTLVAGSPLSGAASAPSAPVLTPAQPSVPPAPPPGKMAVRIITTPADLAESFNQGRGKVRLVAFFSPMCGHCQVNARSIQEDILAKVNDPNLSVSIVWMPVSEADSMQAIGRAASVIPDPRVLHFWDPGVQLDPQLRAAIRFKPRLRLYDIVLVYDRQAQWTDRLPPPGFWMHYFRGAPGPLWDASLLATQVGKALAGQPLDTPRSE